MKYNKAIANWLFLCCFMVAIMVMIGGLTRLTESGLSMTGWKPVTGWLPPMTQEHWEEEFASYKQSPQYKKINHGMDVHEFKSIFWLEFIHRLIGRITGLIFLLPLIYFITKKAVDRKLATGLAGLFALGGTQGIIGWLMVSSGLKDNPYVSQYWLAFHLSMAFIVFSILFILALSKSKAIDKGDKNSQTTRTIKITSLIVSALIFLQVIMGGFVAGLDAGFVYNTFPYMEGKLIPNGLLTINPWYLNIFENVKTVQFTHRVLAYVVTLAILVLFFLSRKFDINKRVRLAINALVAMVAVQFVLGVMTLLHVVPVSLASLHQMGALVLFAISLYINHAIFGKNSVASTNKVIDF